MLKLALALLLSAVLATPTLAQPKEGGIPKNTFFKGQTSSQVLAHGQLIGAKVTGQSNQAIGTVSDLIVSADGRIEGVLLGVGGFLGVGEKKIDVRLGDLKLARSPGRVAITYPTATKEGLRAKEPFKSAATGQYLAAERLIGAKVTNKDGQTIGTIDDLIVGSDNRIDGVILGVGGFLGGGEKKVGVQLRALKIAGEGKASVTLPGATKEMLSAVGAYEFPKHSAKR